MKRIAITPRPDWKKKVEALGFHYHTLDNATYWDESACYEFSYAQIQKLEDATNELYELCLEAVQHVIDNKLYDRFYIPEEFVPLLEKSWKEESPSIYGRFDLSWDGDINKDPKMLEFNADTPTSLFEGGVVQWFWLKDYNERSDQFNSIHEKLVHWWLQVKPHLKGNALYFSCLDEFPEDLINTSYLQDCAMQAGIETKMISVHDIGWNGTHFTDLEEKRIRNIFKLYPWEWLMGEEFGANILRTDTLWMEPPWKMLLSNKAILPVLWELFPGHPNLLGCYFDSARTMNDFISKPLFSREGANVSLVENNTTIAQTGGEYGEEGFIYQALCKLPEFEGNYPVIGSWIIGGQAAGIGIRESRSLITDNFSRFIPHYIKRENLFEKIKRGLFSKL
ncbi:MAG TPA: glutathionylspermidine synthase family protein [Bacteroidia bacterium]|jgi:glutathionylspermidine synthase